MAVEDLGTPLLPLGKKARQIIDLQGERILICAWEREHGASACLEVDHKRALAERIEAYLGRKRSTIAVLPFANLSARIQSSR